MIGRLPSTEDGSSPTTQPLTRKQERFVEEYLIDSNGTRAAIRAGYGKRNAKQTASALLQKAHVAAHLDSLRAVLRERALMKAEEVLAELAKIARSNMGDYLKTTKGGDPYFDYAGLSDDQKAAIAEITVEDFTDGRGDDAREVRRTKFKLHDKRAALVDLGRHLGIFPSKVEVTGKDGAPLSAREEHPQDRVVLALMAILDKARSP